MSDDPVPIPFGERRMSEMGLMYVPGPEHLCPHGLGKAVPCQACEYDNLRTRADRAEAELARVRPVVDAAEALVEHRAEGSWKVTTREAALWDKRHGELLDVLVDSVKEARVARRTVTRSEWQEVTDDD